MQAFDYARAVSIEDVTALLQGAQGRARILGGGTDLLVALRERRLTTELVIDVKRVDALMQLAYAAEHGLTIGAATPLWRICADATVRKWYPGLIDAAHLIGGVQIQGRASLGGNLCNASPAADSIPALIVLRATAEIASAQGRRTVAVEHFCTGPGRTVLSADELLVALHLPPPEPQSGAAYLRFIPRNEMDIAVVGAAAAVTLDADCSRIVEARVALASVAPTPLVVPLAGSALVGRFPGEEAFAAAAAAAQAAAQPITDMRGTAEYRRQLVGVLVRRALQIATARAREGAL